MSAETSNALRYRKLLRQSAEGICLWYPSEEGAVGDVGYLFENGRFNTLFNAFSPPDGLPGLARPAGLPGLRSEYLSNDHLAWMSMSQSGCALHAAVPVESSLLTIGFTAETQTAQGAFLVPGGHSRRVETFFSIRQLSRYLAENYSAIVQRFSDHPNLDTLMILRGTTHSLGYCRGLMRQSFRAMSGAITLQPFSVPLFDVGAAVNRSAAGRWLIQTGPSREELVRLASSTPPEYCIIIKPIVVRKWDKLRRLMTASFSIFTQGPERHVESATGTSSTLSASQGSTGGSNTVASAAAGQSALSAQMKDESNSEGQDDDNDSDGLSLVEDRDPPDDFEALLDAALLANPDLAAVVADWEVFETFIQLYGDNPVHQEKLAFDLEKFETPSGTFAHVRAVSIVAAFIAPDEERPVAALADERPHDIVPPPHSPTRSSELTGSPTSTSLLSRDVPIHLSSEHVPSGAEVGSGAAQKDETPTLRWLSLTAEPSSRPLKSPVSPTERLPTRGRSGKFSPRKLVIANPNQDSGSDEDEPVLPPASRAVKPQSLGDRHLNQLPARMPGRLFKRKQPNETSDTMSQKTSSTISSIDTNQLHPRSGFTFGPVSINERASSTGVPSLSGSPFSPAAPLQPAVATAENGNDAQQTPAPKPLPEDDEDKEYRTLPGKSLGTMGRHGIMPAPMPPLEDDEIDDDNDSILPFKSSLSQTITLAPPPPSLSEAPISASDISPYWLPGRYKHPTEGYQYKPFRNSDSDDGHSPVAQSAEQKPRQRSYSQSRFISRASVTWNVRPSPHELYDRLEEFFPGHDLDKPLLEGHDAQDAAAAMSPVAESSAMRLGALTSSMDEHSLDSRTIRQVAAERKKMLDQMLKVAAQETSKAVVARKKSRNLWDTKVEEHVPREVGTLHTILESPPKTAKPVTRWIKGDFLGNGTYGEAFLGLNINTGEMMAVKQVELHTTLSDQQIQRQRVLIEAIKNESTNLCNLDHPNVVQPLGFEETPDHFSLFLEYVPGGSIGSALRKLGKFDETVTKNFIGQILSGLEYLHSHDVYHGRLKGNNVLVDAQGLCKLSDFGVTNLNADVGIFEHDATSLKGHVSWMAPEVISSQSHGDRAKVDIWSLGCVFIEMVTGQQPWADEDFVSVVYKVTAMRSAPPVSQLDTLGRAFYDLCFERDPMLRPAASVLRVHPYLDIPPGWAFQDFVTVH